MSWWVIAPPHSSWASCKSQRTFLFPCNMPPHSEIEVTHNNPNPFLRALDLRSLKYGLERRGNGVNIFVRWEARHLPSHQNPVSHLTAQSKIVIILPDCTYLGRWSTKQYRAATARSGGKVRRGLECRSETCMARPGIAYLTTYAHTRIQIDRGTDRCSFALAHVRVRDIYLWPDSLLPALHPQDQMRLCTVSAHVSLTLPLIYIIYPLTTTRASHVPDLREEEWEVEETGT